MIIKLYRIGFFCRRLFISTLIFFFIADIAHSQTRIDSLEYLGRIRKYSILNSRFEKQLNTFYLNSQLQAYTEFNNIILSFNENFSSTFIKNENKNTRDEQHFNLNTKYLIDKNFSIGIAGNSSILSDNRSLGINESAVNYAAVFGNIKVDENLIIGPFAGYSANRQIGLTDNGLLYGVEGTANNIAFYDVNINSDLRFRNEDVLPRRNLLRYYNLDVANNFDRYVANNIKTTYAESRKDFYFEIDSISAATFNVNKNIQTRTEKGYNIQDRLSYDKFFEIFSLDLSGGINWRQIDRDIRYKPINPTSSALYDTRIDELKLEFDAITRYKSDFIDAAMRFSFYERDEKNTAKKYEGIAETTFEQRLEQEEQKNNNSTRATLSIFGDIKFSESDFLTLSLYQSKLVYDTKSSLNDDDRDELLSIIRLRYTKKLNHYFSAFVNAEGTYGHTVYLFASRSSNNNQNRIIRLKTGGDYSGAVVRTHNSFEVSANYTVYDFEDITSNSLSYSFRQLTAFDSTSIKLTNRISVSAYGYLKLSEIGDFNWKNFSSRPSRFLNELYLEPKFNLTYKYSLWSAGLRMFSLNTYEYEKTEKKLISEYLSIGPIISIDIIAWNNFNFITTGYYEFISSSGQQSKQQANLILQANWNF